MPDSAARTAGRASAVPPEQIIFDFDGVILDSADLKVDAFAKVYAGEAEEPIAAIMEYQQAHGGVGRREKFVYFEREVFGRAGDARSVQNLCDQYAATISEGMRNAVFIPGAEALLQACLGRARMHVVSGMPQEELEEIVVERDLGRFFESLYGAPTTKTVAFRAILQATPIAPDRSIAIGDSTTEFDAAMETGVPFLAVVPRGRRNRFPISVPVVEDLVQAAAHIGIATAR